jgi:hypothetical protein
MVISEFCWRVGTIFASTSRALIRLTPASETGAHSRLSLHLSACLATRRLFSAVWHGGSPLECLAQCACSSSTERYLCGYHKYYPFHRLAILEMAREGPSGRRCGLRQLLTRMNRPYKTIGGDVRASECVLVGRRESSTSHSGDASDSGRAGG